MLCSDRNNQRDSVLHENSLGAATEGQMRVLVARLLSPSSEIRVRYSNNFEMVGERGFEPPAPTSRTWCSTRLSYSPVAKRGRLITAGLARRNGLWVPPFRGFSFSFHCRTATA